MNTIRHAGFTMLEILVALIVLATGLLGLLALQLHTMRAQQDAHFESIATQSASDIFEQLSAARGSDGSAGDWQHFALDSRTVQGDAISCYGVDADCSTGHAAAFALRESVAVLKSEIPGARIVICRDRAAWSAADVAWRWRCDGSAASPFWVKVGWPARRDPGTTTSPPQLSIMLATLAS